MRPECVDAVGQQALARQGTDGVMEHHVALDLAQGLQGSTGRRIAGRPAFEDARDLRVGA